MSSMDITRYAEQVADNVAQAIEKAGLTKAGAATRSGIPRTTLIRQLEHPDAYPFNVRQLAQLSIATGAPVTKLMKPVRH